MLRFGIWRAAALALIFFRCASPADEGPSRIDIRQQPDLTQDSSSHTNGYTSTGILGYVAVPHDVSIGHYFRFLDSLVNATDTSRGWKGSEYVLAHSNPWILDSLKASDYYIQKGRGVFLFDQSKKVVLHRGDSLAIPDSLWATSILEKLNSTIIDLNIPEYTMRIFQSGDTLLKTKVRVGRNGTQYLELAGHDVDLRTPIGEGKIIRVERNPIVINPETGIRYKGTYRDDGRFTKMPVIPWLEPEINGIRYGALIHPTTNPATIGFPYSHGCVGTSEADAWTIYYNAPIGTRVNFRYDLSVVNDHGDSLLLADIYKIRTGK
jgi:L,D-transpeptidase ErfK/SrfK